MNLVGKLSNTERSWDRPPLQGCRQLGLGRRFEISQSAMGQKENTEKDANYVKIFIIFRQGLWKV